MISAATQLNNNSSGNGSFSSLNRRKKQEDEQQEFVYLDKNDRRMRFNTSKDPIYFVFETMDKQPVSVLARVFVKDTLFEITNFVSKVVR